MAEFIADCLEKSFYLLCLFTKALDLDETAVVFQESCGAFKYRKLVLFDVDFEEQRLIRNRKKVIEPNRLDFDDILFPGPSHMRATGGHVHIQHEPELSVDVSHGKKVRAYHVGQLVEIEVSTKMMEVTDVGLKNQDFRDLWVACQKHRVIPEIRANIEEDIAAMPFGLVCEIAHMLPIVAADQSHMPVDIVTIIDKEKCTRDTDNLIPTLPCDSGPSFRNCWQLAPQNRYAPAHDVSENHSCYFLG